MKVLSVQQYKVSARKNFVKISGNENFNSSNMCSTKPTIENMFAYSGYVSFGAKLLKFKEFAVKPSNKMYKKLISREIEPAKGIKDYRDNFDIDYDRIL